MQTNDYYNSATPRKVNAQQSGFSLVGMHQFWSGSANKFLGTFVSLTVFVGASWGITLYPFEDMNIRYITYVLMVGMISIPYLFLLRSKGQLIDWRVGAFLAFVTSIAAPVTLETDQLRYIWDGLLGYNGLNPYRLAPDQVDFYGKIFWASGINHADINTVYPPIAQVMFMLSSMLNPYFWSGYLHWPVRFELIPNNLWQVQIGWKITAGCATVLTVFLLRKKRWDLMIFHPLYLTKAIANAHVDLLVVAAMAALFYGTWSRRGELIQNLAFAAMVLAKWYPLIIAPFLLIHWKRRFGFINATSASFLFVSVVSLLVAIYFIGSDGNFFASTIVYGKHWYFFGYFHRFIADFLTLVSDPALAIDRAKLVSAAFGLIWAGYIYFGFYLTRRISLRMAILLLLFGFFAMSPTLHPWYLLVLLPVGLPYFRILVTPWLWPILGLTSAIYYVDRTDPTALRYAVYLTITFFLFKDLRLILRKRGAPIATT
jgi:hypothetical protein